MKRLLEETGDAFELALLRSAKADQAPNDSAEKAALALAGAVTLGTLASSTAAGAASATGTAKAAKATAIAGKLGVFAIWKWIGLGVVVGSAVTMGTEHVVRHTEVALAPPAVVAAALPGPQEAVLSAPPALAAPEIVPPAPIAAASAASPASARVPRVDAPPPPSAAAISAEIAAISAPPAVAASASAVPVPAPNASALATEVMALDRARRALAAKDPAEAIRLLDIYERDIPVRALGPEAQVLRIEAVSARGDRAAAKKLGEQF
ncbi:MAG: hypothetical protein ABIP89_14110, partial [Polyangiaceae bacterium]